MTVPFAGFQNEIYLGGMAGRHPRLPMDWVELERRAQATMQSGPQGYVFGGAGREDTMRANREAFDAWRIVPRMLRNVETRSLQRTVLGTTLPAPFLLAPIGVQSIVAPQAELAVARAAASLEVPLVVSTAASHTLEDIAQAGGSGPRWFQLYWPRGEELTRSLVGRAQAAGYEAIVITLDTWLLGWRPRDLRGAYLPFLWSEGIANYLSDPVFRAALERPPEEDALAAVGHFVGLFSNPTVTWDDLSLVRDCTDLPILLKGILHPDDAREAADRGMNGVVVSNHGGRQVDGAIGALAALPAVVDAVGAELTVLFDSGIRGGADAFKALALGARAVLLGRPYLWGLALAGEEGVRHVLRCLLAELDLTLALSGYTTFDDVDRSALQPA